VCVGVWFLIVGGGLLGCVCVCGVCCCLVVCGFSVMVGL
jgi:hypothetical protein